MGNFKVEKMTIRKVDLQDKLWMGKYKGKSVYSVIEDDPKYINWCLENDVFKLDEEGRNMLVDHFNYAVENEETEEDRGDNYGDR